MVNKEGSPVQVLVARAEKDREGVPRWLQLRCHLSPCHQDLNRIVFFLNYVKTFVVYVTTRGDPVAYTTQLEAWKVPTDVHEGCLTPSKVGWSKERASLC